VRCSASKCQVRFLVLLSVGGVAFAERREQSAYLLVDFLEVESYVTTDGLMCDDELHHLFVILHSQARPQCACTLTSGRYSHCFACTSRKGPPAFDENKNKCILGTVAILLESKEK